MNKFKYIAGMLTSRNVSVQLPRGQVDGRRC